MKQNIVFFVTSLESGGIENYLLRFLKEKYTAFSSIFVFCKSGKGGQLESEYLGIPNVKVIKHNIRFLNARKIIYLKKFLVKNKTSVVCDFTGNFAGPVLLVAKMASVDKRVAFYRNSSNRFSPNLIKNTYNNICKLLVQINATDILANSKTGLDYYFPNNEQNDSKYRVIFNGINAAHFINNKANLRATFGIPDTAFVIGHTGRFDESKNHSTILKVAEKMIDSYDDIYFIMCGNGVKQNIQTLLEQKKLTDRVLAFENRRDIPIFLNTMDCYFFPSLTEGQPNALIEALITGLPYTASNIDSIKEVTTNTKYLHDPRDTRSFINSLTKIYYQRPGRNLIQQQQYINRFDHIKKFDDLLEVLIAL